MKDRVTRKAAKELTTQTTTSAPAAAMALTIQTTVPALAAPMAPTIPTPMAAMEPTIQTTASSSDTTKRNTKRSLVKVEQDDNSLAGPSKKAKHRKTKHNKKGKGRADDPIVVADSEDEGEEMFEEWIGLTPL